MSDLGYFTAQCICGNVLDQRRRTEPGDIKLQQSPCRCEKPGPGPSASPCRDLPTSVSEKQYRERTRLGLPVESDIEKGIRNRWT